MDCNKALSIIYKGKKGYLLRLRKAVAHYGYKEKEVLMAIADSQFTFIMKQMLIKSFAHSPELLTIINQSRGAWFLPTEIQKYYERK
jgi:hypothetical protein